MSGPVRAEALTPERLSELLDLIAENARQRWPAPTPLLNSDVAWRLPGAEDDVQLFYDDAGLAAYAWFELVTPAVLDLRWGLGSDHPAMTAALDWLAERRCAEGPRLPWLLELESMEDWEHALAAGRHTQPGTERLLLVSAFDGDQARVDALEAAGFSATGHFDWYLHQSLEDFAAEPVLPAGYSVRAVRAAETERRVALHRKSWFASTYDLAQYDALRGLAAYDSELDLVAEAPDGALLSYCVAWTDPVSSIGSIEPVGTAPRGRRLGLARALQLEALGRMQARGMRRAKISTAGFNDPAFGLYRSCGFEVADRLRTYSKAVSRSTAAADLSGP